jgi:hypothetical protein
MTDTIETKVLEIRDEGTCIPVIALRMLAHDPVRAYYIHDRCGYPQNGSGIVVMTLADQRASVDPYAWERRTMGNAHNYIYNNFDRLKDGDVVDVRVIVGEAKEPVTSERLQTREHEVTV